MEASVDVRMMWARSGSPLRLQNLYGIVALNPSPVIDYSRIADALCSHAIESGFKFRLQRLTLIVRAPTSALEVKTGHCGVLAGLASMPPQTCI